MTEWISVEDRFPEKEGTYITVQNWDEKCIPAPDDIGGSWFNKNLGYFTWESMGGCMYKDADVTHWAPLPEPPNSEDE